MFYYEPTTGAAFLQRSLGGKSFISRLPCSLWGNLGGIRTSISVSRAVKDGLCAQSPLQVRVCQCLSRQGEHCYRLSATGALPQLDAQRTLPQPPRPHHAEAQGA